MSPEHDHTHGHDHGHDHPHDHEHHYDDIVIPALLRASRSSYGDAIRKRLATAGFDDLPRNSAYVLGGMANQGGNTSDLIRELGISKQAASQLIDTLVIRGYLDRAADSEDRRRMTIELTERGRDAARAIRAGVLAVDAELNQMISPEELRGLRIGLIALTEIRERMEAGFELPDAPEK